MSELERPVKTILQMGQHWLERGSDLARVTQPVRGRGKPIATRRVCALQPLSSSRGVSQSLGVESLGSKSSEPHLEGGGPPFPCAHFWASGEGDMGMPSSEWEPCLPTSRQPPLQPAPQGLQGTAAPAGSCTHRTSG